MKREAFSAAKPLFFLIITQSLFLIPKVLSPIALNEMRMIGDTCCRMVGEGLLEDHLLAVDDREAVGGVGLLTHEVEAVGLGRSVEGLDAYSLAYGE